MEKSFLDTFALNIKTDDKEKSWKKIATNHNKTYAVV